MTRLALAVLLLPVAACAPPPNTAPDTAWVDVPLQAADPLRVVRDGEPSPMAYGYPLWAPDARPATLRGVRRYSRVGAVPAGLRDTLTFAAVVSEAPDNTVLVLAGRRTPGGPWRVYLDRDNDETITEDEVLFVAEADDDNGGRPHKAARASAVVRYDSLSGDRAVERERTAEVVWVQNNVGVQSTRRHGSPLFLFEAHAALAEGAITVADTAYTIALRAPFTGLHPPFETVEVLVDRNGDGLYDVGRGSDERYEPDEVFTVGGAGWTLDEVGPGGRWARFRTAAGAAAPPAASSQTGEPAPPWEATTLEGDALGSADLAGRYVLLDFWASWCSPCVAELPFLRQAARAFDRLAVVGVATQDSEAAVRAAVGRHALAWPVVYDTGDEIASAFRVVGLPDPVLVGPDGRVVERGEALRGARLDATLRRHLGNE